MKFVEEKVKFADESMYHNEGDKRKVREFNKGVLQMALGTLNRFGAGLKKNAFKDADRVWFAFPNPYLAEPVPINPENRMEGMRFNLVDGGTNDNSGVTTSVYFMQRRYNDDSMPNNDQDCDGVLTTYDCYDYDESLLSIDNDADCDGVLTTNDCNDHDESLRSKDTDAD